MNKWIDTKVKKYGMLQWSVMNIFSFCHKHNSLPLGSIQPSSPSTKELHGWPQLKHFYRLYFTCLCFSFPTGRCLRMPKRISADLLPIERINQDFGIAQQQDHGYQDPDNDPNGGRGRNWDLSDRRLGLRGRLCQDLDRGRENFRLPRPQVQGGKYIFDALKLL